MSCWTRNDNIVARTELLFEIGAYAIADGYYREAVSSFTAALERFYEFAIRVLLEERTGSDDLFQQCWKPLARYSERQLGGFVLAWSLVVGGKPDLLPNPKVEFRNGVIHRGQIPTREEAIAYGDSVVGCLRPQLQELQQNHQKAVRKVIFYHLRFCATEADKGRTVVTTTVPMFLSLARAAPFGTLTEYVDHLTSGHGWQRLMR